MKFNLRNFFAFGLLFSFAFLVISAFFVYISPDTNINTPEDSLFFGFTINAWKTQFVFSFLLVIIFFILLIFKINWSVINSFIKSEYPRKIWNSSELWSSLISVFIVIALAGSDLTIFRKVAGTYNANNTITITANNKLPDNNNNYSNQSSDLRKVSLADLTYDQIAENYKNMTGDMALDKLIKEGIKCPEDAKTIGQVALANNFPVNEIIQIIEFGELLSPYIKNGKPIKNRSIDDASVEIGIPAPHLFKILDSYGITYSGKTDQTFTNISLSNDYSPEDIYSLLDSRGTKNLPKKSNTKEIQDFADAASSMTIASLATVIIQQQPDAEVSVEVITERLADNNITIDDKNATLSQIATANNTSIDDIIRIVSFGSRQDPNDNSGTRKMDGPPQNLTNKDNSKAIEFIRTPLTELANKYNMSIDEMINTLSVNGIVSTKSETIEEIAKNNNKKPGPIIKILREERIRQQKTN